MQLLKPGVLLVSSLAVAFASCKEEGKAPVGPAPGAPVARIWISQSGTVELDGKPVELGALAKALDGLAAKKGVVYYGRDAAAQEAPAVSMQIIKLITDRRLPIRLSTKKDFSDVVVPN